MSVETAVEEHREQIANRLGEPDRLQFPSGWTLSDELAASAGRRVERLSDEPGRVRRAARLRRQPRRNNASPRSLRALRGDPSPSASATGGATAAGAPTSRCSGGTGAAISSASRTSTPGGRTSRRRGGSSSSPAPKRRLNCPLLISLLSRTVVSDDLRFDCFGGNNWNVRTVRNADPVVRHRFSRYRRLRRPLVGSSKSYEGTGGVKIGAHVTHPRV